MKVTMIFGPPGTGKTRQLVDLVAEEMKSNARGMLFLSYTKAAAAEATSRVIKAGRIAVSTLHALAYSVLGLNRASVVDRDKMQDFSKRVGVPIATKEEEKQVGDEYMQVISYARNVIMAPMRAYDHFGRPGTPAQFEAFVEGYENYKEAYGLVDFDDMLARLGCVNENQLPLYEVIFLDEAQDCSPLQWTAFRRACLRAKRVYIAGDDDQAIYEWNGANPHGMDEFLSNNAGERIVLDQSYRVPRAVWHLAHHDLLPNISRRVDKKFACRPAEGLITRYGDITNFNLTGFHATGGGMILARDRYRLDEIRRNLNRELIPYDMPGGFSPWTSRVGLRLAAGEMVPDAEIPPSWRSFYRQADMSQPVNISLSTIHQAKGREAKAVVVDLELQPRVLMEMDRDPDAELRVMYVAVTRASEELILCGSNPLI